MKSRLYSVDRPADTPENKKILQALDTPTAVKFIDTQFLECLKVLAKQHDIAIVPMEAELKVMGISDSGIINLEVSGISLRSVLKLLLQELQCAYVVEEGKLIVGPKSIRETSKSARLEVVRPSPDEVALIQVLDKNCSVDFSGESWDKCLDKLATDHHVHLIKDTQLLKAAGVDTTKNIDLRLTDVPVRVALQRLLQPQHCDYAIEHGALFIRAGTGAGRFGSIRPFESTLSLVIRQTPQVHAEIAELLGEIRKLHDNPSVQLDVRIVRIADRHFESLGITEETTVFDEQGFQKLQKSLDTLRAPTITAPKITMFMGQTGEINSTGQNGEELKWLIGTKIGERDQSVRVTLVVNATKPADALESNWMATLTTGKYMVVDATNRLLSEQRPGVPNIPAQDTRLFGKFAARPAIRTLVLITPKLISAQTDGGEATDAQAWQKLGLRPARMVETADVADERR